MVRAVVVLVLAVTSIVGSSLACTVGHGREDVAIGRLHTLLCDVAAACDCTNVGTVCGDWQQAEPGGTFDESCLEVWAQWAESLGCGTSALPIEPRLCPLYHGTLYEGMPCQSSIEPLEIAPLATDCGRGLVCIAGICRDAATVVLGTEGQPCDVGFRCDEGLYCEQQSSCERLPGPGEACPDWVCAQGYLCDEVCKLLPGADEPCLRNQCAEGLACEAGVCAPKAAVGEPCFGHRECQSGNCPAGFCAPVPQPGDPCSSQLPCGPDQACIEQVCERVVEQDDAGGDQRLSATCELLWAF